MAALNKVVQSASHSQQEAGFKAVSPILSKWVPHLKRAPGKCRQS